MTNPKRVGAPRPPDEVLATVETLLSLPGLRVLLVPQDIVQRWVALCRQRLVTGAVIYDLQIAAVMLANGVERICTFDTADFAGIASIRAETP